MLVNILRDIIVTILVITFNCISVHCLKVYIQNRQRMAGKTYYQTLIHPCNYSNDENNNRSTKVQIKLTRMVTVLCSLTVLEHIGCTIHLVYLYFPNYDIHYFVAVSMFGVFFVALKHSSNFFVFYIFNSKFRKVCHFDITRLFSFLKFNKSV